MEGALAPMAVQLAFALAFAGLAIWKFRSDQR
jgi:ABC-2 type transport system permease protein